MFHIPMLLGSLMYLAIATRPDLAQAVGILGRFSSNPGIQHWKAVKHVFRYIKGTMDMKLTYAPNPDAPELFSTYCDADHAGCPDSGCSTGAYVVKIGTGAVSWSSKLQSITTLSTTEAEYVAAVSAGQEILWMRNLLGELGFALPSSSTLHMDSLSAISVAKNPEHHGRMKHLDLRFFWLRDVVNEGVIAIAHCPTSLMPADALTKNLSFTQFDACQKMLGLRG